MVERSEPPDPRWTAVKGFIAGLLGDVPALSPDERIRGIRALFDAVAAEPRLTATAVQTVGAKKWDGVLLAAVRE